MSTRLWWFLTGLVVGMTVMTVLFVATTPQFNYSNEYEVAHAEWKVFAAEVDLQNLKEELRYEDLQNLKEELRYERGED